MAYLTHQDFSSMEDEQIIELVHEHNASAMEYILEKYKYLVRRKARTLFLIGGDRDDLIQEGMIGLYKATQSFTSGANHSFPQFADVCITGQMYNAIKASTRLKNLPLNDYVSIYSPFGDADGVPSDSGAATPLIDTMSTGWNQNPEEILIDKETRYMIEYELGKRLSPTEQKVYHLYVNGMTYQGIAQNLNKTTKSIDNALQRVRGKLASLLQEMRG